MAGFNQAFSVLFTGMATVYLLKWGYTEAIPIYPWSIICPAHLEKAARGSFPVKLRLDNGEDSVAGYAVNDTNRLRLSNVFLLLLLLLLFFQQQVDTSKNIEQKIIDFSYPLPLDLPLPMRKWAGSQD